MHVAVLLTILAVLLPSAAQAQARSDLLDRMGAAVGLAESGHWDAAATEFRTAASLDPDDALAYLGLGAAELARRRANEAAPWFRRALACERADASAWTGLGLCGVCLGDVQQAEEALGQALARDATIGTALFYRAVLALTRGDQVRAADLLSLARAQSVAPALTDYVEALRQLALGRQERATELLRSLQPKTAAQGKGLPWALPLELRAADGGAVVFSLPTGSALTTQVAPAAAPVSVEVDTPSSNGPLIVEQPLPNAVVSGKVTIRAQLVGARDFDYVAISVDGRVQAITNREPYFAVWDSVNAADGPHQITVRAVGAREVMVQFVANLRNRTVAMAAGRANPYDPTRYRDLTNRVNGLLIHRLPPTSIEKMLLDALEPTQPQAATDLCERLLAADPARVDLLRRLLPLYQRTAVSLNPNTLPEPHEGFRTGKRVCLTFDDGPRPGVTEPILALLAQYGVKGTFLVTGVMSERYPELVRAIAAGGNEVGSHTYSHFRLDTLSPEQQMVEMVRAKVVIDDALGHASPRFMRPPGGHYNPQIKRSLAAVGYWPVFWNINCGSYTQNEPDAAAAAIVKRLTDGSILLLHNGTDNTLALLPHLLRRLTAAGWRGVGLTDITTGPDGQPRRGSPAIAPAGVETHGAK